VWLQNPGEDEQRELAIYVDEVGQKEQRSISGDFFFSSPVTHSVDPSETVGSAQQPSGVTG
jgi:hypothetical protein